MILIYLYVFFIGLICGSFVTALVWRVHTSTTLKPKKPTEGPNLSIVNGRSLCPNCKHLLKPVDLVPVFSWLFLKGKCRYCHKKISASYPLTELATGLLFILSLLFWPHSLHGVFLFEFISWLVILTVLIALLIYDFRWMILPNVIVFTLTIIAVIRLLIIVLFTNQLSLVLSAFWGILIIFGLFYILFQISNGKWIGGGDVKLGIPLGIIVGGPLSSMLLLFIASLLGTVYAIPIMARGKLTKSRVIPFGPFLIAATIIVVLFGANIISWYKRGLGL